MELAELTVRGFTEEIASASPAPGGGRAAAGAAEVIANGVLKAYTSNGATLSVLLYLRAFEDGDFDSAWAIGAVLLVLVLAINLAARLAKTKLKQKQ